MEEHKYDEIRRQASEAIHKDLQDIFHGEASRFVDDSVLFDLVIDNRIDYWIAHYQSLYPDLQSNSDLLTWKEQIKKQLKNTLLKNKQTPPSKNKISSSLKKEFDSIEEAFLHLIDKKSEHYKAFSKEMKQTLSDALYYMKKGRISMERLIKFLKTTFEVEHKVILSNKKEGSEKKIIKNSIIYEIFLYLLSISNSKSNYYLSSRSLQMSIS